MQYAQSQVLGKNHNYVLAGIGYAYELFARRKQSQQWHWNLLEPFAWWLPKVLRLTMKKVVRLRTAASDHQQTIPQL